MLSAPASPCTRVCRIGRDGLCEGCQRTLDEIVEWGAATAERQRTILAFIAERRGSGAA